MKLYLFLLLLVLCGTHPAFSTENSTIEALEALKRGLVGVNDFTADVVQEKQLALMKKKLVSKGKVRFKKPGMFFMEFFMPHASRLILKGNVMTIWLPEQGDIQKVVLPPENGLDRWLSYLDRPINSLPRDLELKAERKGQLWSLRVVPQKGGVKGMQLNYDTDGRISRIIINENNGDRTDIRFSNVKRNVGLKDLDFVQD